MRSEQEMLNQILEIAQKDDRILAVYMGGSRTNPNVVKDIFQDYDVMYVVEETASFRADKTWIDKFGERLYMQYPEENGDILGFHADIENCYGWLMQFADGNRLDLHVCTIKHAKQDIETEKLCKMLLDKQGILPEISEATDAAYFVKKPCEITFVAACNEFWWCLNNVAKGLWRKEIPYVQDMLHSYIRPQLVKILSWKIGIETDFSCSVGKSGKYMSHFLPEKTWVQFLQTYATGDVEAIWQAVFVMCDLFTATAGEVSVQLGFVYDEQEAKASFDYLHHVKNLPRGASEIY